MSEENRLFLQIFPAKSSKLHPTCPWDLFEEKNEKVHFFLQSVSDLEERKFGMSLTFSGELSKVHSKFSYYYSEESCFPWKRMFFIIYDIADNTSSPRYRSCHWHYPTISTLARHFVPYRLPSSQPLAYINVRLSRASPV